MFHHQIKRLMATCLALVLMCVSAALMAAETYPGSDPQNAPIVVLAKETPSQRSVTLKEQWRIGGDDDDDVLMGLILAGQIDASGFTYLLDLQLSQILVISPDGEFVKTLGREGEGPGEMRRPVGLVLFDDGMVAAAQSFPAKVITLDAEGNPGPALNLGGGAAGGFAFLMQLKHRNGHTIVGQGVGSFDPETQKISNTLSLVSVDKTGTELVRFSESNNEMDMAQITFDEAKSFSIIGERFALGTNSQLFTAPVRDSYEIHVRNMDGITQKVLTREFPLRKRSKEDKEDLDLGPMMRMGRGNAEMERHILDTDPPITSLAAGDNGNLYVRNCYTRSKEMKDGMMTRYDVINPEGQLVEELTIVCPNGDAEKDQLIFLDGDKFLLIRNATAANAAFMAGFNSSEADEEVDMEAEPLEVILYNMPR